MNWRAQAECRNAPADVDFVPDTNKPTDLIWLAQTFCQDCPVINDCAADADHYQDVGLRAGYYRIRKGTGAYRWTPLIDDAPVPRPVNRQTGDPIRAVAS